MKIVKTKAAVDHHGLLTFARGGMNLRSKEEYADAVATERARAAKQEYILKGPKADSWSATKPAYTYTSLCPDPKRRKSPVRKNVQHEA